MLTGGGLHHSAPGEGRCHSVEGREQVMDAHSKYKG